ncbi:hypothetical protein DWB77_00523 [Streptomyces hundungensis]|uniref:Uncharacterized protein n=1 Tax=Streptomyces hundungensis TaxID=1077946 RepID=A0A387H400_9ACTN|nr:hypothetical protein DWB77_00523 [Streptomyces hundungensis]
MVRGPQCGDALEGEVMTGEAIVAVHDLALAR